MGTHPIVHVKLAAKDPADSARFYNGLFGWRTYQIGEMNYTAFEADGGPSGGFVAADGCGIREGQICFDIAVEDIESTVKRAAEMGAKVVMGKTDLPNGVSFACLVDPGGVDFCVVTLPPGMDKADPEKRNHPIVHVSIAARDRAESARFYGELFGWRTTDHPEMDYTVFEPGEGPSGGFMTVGTNGLPVGDVHVYVETDDIEATLKRAEELGATKHLDKTEMPGVGWMGALKDPAGTEVWLFTEQAASNAAAAD